MKRMQYSIEVAGRILATREQADAVVKAIKTSLAVIDAKGGLTKVEVELRAERKPMTPRKTKAATHPVSQQGELVKPN